MLSSKNEFPHLGEELRRFFEWTMPSAEERRLKAVRLLGRGGTRNQEEHGPDVEPQPLELAVELEPPASNGPVEKLVETAGRRARRSERIVRGHVGSARRVGGHGETLPADMNPGYGFLRSPVAEREQVRSAMDGTLLAETTGADGFKADLPSSRDGQATGREGAWTNSAVPGAGAAFAAQSLAAMSRHSDPRVFTAPAREEGAPRLSGLPGRIESFTTQPAAPFGPTSAYLRELAGHDDRRPSLGAQASWRTPKGDGEWHGQASPPAIPFHRSADIDNERPMSPRSESRHEPALNVSIPDAAFLSEGQAAWSTSSAAYDADGRMRSAVPERSGPGLSDLLEETRLRELLADILRTDALRHGLVLKER
ncbi:hypothetical protein E5161_07200 [Cohnella pontilimi]|uniref:Uncharacterized protein n=1 Tax=Cohnella pontilimi TaxID=2564100 RepID=A0A4U0FGX2_9BACL|nr:hypothetical protein [Cohnella pontilimi]TJY42632.1 hypothetical protein E5161_07200 [Cohnella pontilimi]